MSVAVSDLAKAGYPLEAVLDVMKPQAINLDNAGHQKRLAMMYKSPRYVAEPKIDGCHYTAIGERFFSTRISKVTNSPVEKTDRVPHLSSTLLSAGFPRLILDGEIFYPDGRSSNVNSILGCLPREAIDRQQDNWLRYMVFDVLRDPDGNWLFETPWMVRREILESLEPLFKGSNIQIVPVRRSRKEEYLQHLLDEGKEGIVLKDAHGLYYPGKRPSWNWVKMKTELDDDVVIMGFDPPTKEYTGKLVPTKDNWPYWEGNMPVTRIHHYNWIGAIRFGKYNSEGELVQLGTCSGIEDRLREELSRNGGKYIGTVMKIKAMERTDDGYYRHPRFFELHTDKNARECVI